MNERDDVTRNESPSRKIMLPARTVPWPGAVPPTCCQFQPSSPFSKPRFSGGSRGLVLAVAITGGAASADVAVGASPAAIALFIAADVAVELEPLGTEPAVEPAGALGAAAPMGDEF